VPSDKDDVAILLSSGYEILRGRVIGSQHLPELPILVVLVLVGLFFATATGTPLANHIPVWVLGLLACLVYNFIAVCVDVSIMAQKIQDRTVMEYGVLQKAAFVFDPCVAVMLTEFLKLVISAMIYGFAELYRHSYKNRESDVRFRVSSQQGLNRYDIMWWSLPAALFTMNNALVWFAIGGNDSSTYGVLRDTLVIWSAVLWRSIFKVELGTIRLLAISAVFTGCLVNQVTATMHHQGRTWNWSACIVLLMTACNALGTVLNEFALKRRPDLDINLQNIILYCLCSLFSLALVLCGGHLHALSVEGLFAGFNHHAAFTVTLQVIAGLFVSRILAYADSITKSIAASLRGPVLIFVSMQFVPTHISVGTVASIVLVFSGCATFLLQGPLLGASGASGMSKTRSQEHVHAYMEQARQDALKKGLSDPYANYDSDDDDDDTDGTETTESFSDETFEASTDRFKCEDTESTAAHDSDLGSDGSRRSSAKI